MMSGGLSEVTTGMHACLKAQEERIRDSDGSVRVMRAWEEAPLVLDIPGVVFRHILGRSRNVCYQGEECFFFQ